MADMKIIISCSSKATVIFMLLYSTIVMRSVFNKTLFWLFLPHTPGDLFDHKHFCNSQVFPNNGSNIFLDMIKSAYCFMGKASKDQCIAGSKQTNAKMCSRFTFLIH